MTTETLTSAEYQARYGARNAVPSNKSTTSKKGRPSIPDCIEAAKTKKTDNMPKTDPKPPKSLYCFNVTPMGKPSYQKSDKWRTVNHKNPDYRQRPCITKYLEFSNDLLNSAKKQEFVMPASGAQIVFTLPMPDSWGKRKRIEMNGSMHQQKPDLDNLLKGFFDSVCPDDDSYISSYHPSKEWGEEGKIIVIIK